MNKSGMTNKFYELPSISYIEMDIEGVMCNSDRANEKLDEDEGVWY